MSSRSPQQGFAIALLLWMIAGMSLMVAAVIHFARGDVGMAELRLSEAKTAAAARGAATLTLRDMAMNSFDKKIDEQTADGDEGAGEGPHQGAPLRFSYRLFSGVMADVLVRPANGFVSINDASKQELEDIFVEIGGADRSEALEMAAAANEYRYKFPGFRAREELLAIGNMRKSVYDRVSPYVHPYRSGSIDPVSASGALRDVLQSDNDSKLNRSSSQSAQGLVGASVGTPGGVITFESIAAQKELQATQGVQVSALDVTITMSAELKMDIRLWAEHGEFGSFLRMSMPTRRESGAGKLNE